MAEKPKATRRHNSHLYYRLAMASLVLVLLVGLGGVGWFIWSTMDDVVNHNDGSQNVKVQGVNTETLTALEKRDLERRGTANDLPPLSRDPFVTGNPTAQAATTASATEPAPTPKPSIPSIQ
jgi:hypothetical protein